MARKERKLEQQVMVESMLSTSLATTPAYAPGQPLKIVAPDGALLLGFDRAPPVTCRDGLIDGPDSEWVTPTSLAAIV